MLILRRNYVFRIYPINRNHSGPAERVRLVTCRLTSDYPAKEYHHWWGPSSQVLRIPSRDSLHKVEAIWGLFWSISLENCLSITLALSLKLRFLTRQLFTQMHSLFITHFLLGGSSLIKKH